jgi:putative ABC transport system permease protein
MNTLEAMRIALTSLWANKLRSVLTLLGVVISVASLITVVTLVNGINGYVAEKIFNLGADVFIVSKQSNVITNIDQFTEGQKRKDIKFEDYEALAEGCTACKYVGATAGTYQGKIRFNEQSSTDTAVRGWTPSMGPIYDLDLSAGRSITESDMNATSNVVVIGSDIRENLMGGVDPIGKEIRVDGQMYVVIGVGVPKGTTLGQSQDNWVMLPLTTWLKQYGQHTSLRIWAKAYGIGAPLDAAIDQCRVVMRSRRHDRVGVPDSFVAETNASFLSLWSGISQTFFGVMIAIASIALVVGGIVIMNIMLVSVSERTREIGIRKAMGARRSDVLQQFLIESGTMSLVGGFFGVILGKTLAVLITLLIGMPTVLPLWVILAALVLAASVGIFFGMYPAGKAAKLDPIAALRFEL